MFCTNFMIILQIYLFSVLYYIYIMDNEKYSFLGFKFFSNFTDTKKTNLNKKCNKYSYIVNIALLIINIILIFNIFIRYKDSNYVNDKFISQLGNYSLYNLFKYPQIS
jgi:hypothetical protein